MPTSTLTVSLHWKVEWPQFHPPSSICENITVLGRWSPGWLISLAAQDSVRCQLHPKRQHAKFMIDRGHANTISGFRPQHQSSQAVLCCIQLFCVQLSSSPWTWAIEQRGCHQSSDHSHLHTLLVLCWFHNFSLVWRKSFLQVPPFSFLHSCHFLGRWYFPSSWMVTHRTPSSHFWPCQTSE